jgi:hypothetical protein
MSLAFQCDLCNCFQSGDPLVSHEMKGTDPDHPGRTIREEWCNECLVSFGDWKAQRILVGTNYELAA